MDLDQETLNKLLEVFKIELAEQTQIIIDGLLNLEKGNASPQDQEKIIEMIFRSAHNIKGTARGMGIPNLGDIAHHIETLFSSIQKKSLAVTPAIIDLCLEAVDCMRSAMLSFTEKKPLNFNLDRLLTRLQGNEIDTVPTPTPLIHEPEVAAEIKEYETIRVSISNLDRVSSLIEEMQVVKIAIDDQYADLTALTNKTKNLLQIGKQLNFSVQLKESSENFRKLYQGSTDKLIEINSDAQNLQKNMHARINDLAILSDSLQEEVRMLRLVPASILLRTLPRTVRDLAKTLNKKVELKITGDGVKIDKIVLEGLQDPLTHLLRNAIDHGIEKAETRLQNNKPENGQIEIDIREEGDHITMRISDDGAGIDVNKIAAIAEQKKLVTPSELNIMSQTDILELLFRPGFTTKEIITDVSGRGVGLDVVKANLTNLKGQISITTEIGKGTTFLLRIPLTLASERGLVVKSGGQTLVVPISLVERVLLLPTSKIIDIESSQAILIDSHPIQLRVLADVIGLPKQDFLSQERLPIIVIRKGRHVIAFIVDEIMSEREIVIKPLHAPLINVACVAGGTLTGNGEIIIVLNVSDLMNMALRSDKQADIIFKDAEEEPKKQPHILVVDDSITTRTLEKNILESKNYLVTTAVNGKEAWDLLQQHDFSLLITDVTMPIMDGFTLTEQVKQNDKLNKMPVIIVTSLGSDSEKKRGVDVGANAYIIKNEFESGTLLEIVEQLV